VQPRTSKGITDLLLPQPSFGLRTDSRERIDIPLIKEAQNTLLRSRSLTELTRQIAPPTKNGHAPLSIGSRKSSQSVNPLYVWTWWARDYQSTGGFIHTCWQTRAVGTMVGEAIHIMQDNTLRQVPKGEWVFPLKIPKQANMGGAWEQNAHHGLRLLATLGQDEQTGQVLTHSATTLEATITTLIFETRKHSRCDCGLMQDAAFQPVSER